MSKIPKLFELMNERGITAKKVSIDTGISTGNISDWKSGRSKPSIEKLKLLADYFNVTPAYLMGWENEELENTSKDVISVNKNLSKEEILSLAKEKGIKISFLNDLIGGYRGKLTDWKNGKTSLTENELSIITDYLLEKENSPTNSADISPEDKEIMNMIKSLSPEKKEMFLKFLKSL